MIQQFLYRLFYRERKLESLLPQSFFLFAFYTVADLHPIVELSTNVLQGFFTEDKAKKCPEIS